MKPNTHGLQCQNQEIGIELVLAHVRCGIPDHLKVEINFIVSGTLGRQCRINTVLAGFARLSLPFPLNSHSKSCHSKGVFPDSIHQAIIVHCFEWVGVGWRYDTSYYMIHTLFSSNFRHSVPLQQSQCRRNESF
jgi:hypothetical protein